MSETRKNPERSKSKPGPKALPVARVVSPPVQATEPEYWRKRLAGHRKRSWLATSAICVTVLLIPLMVWWSGRGESPAQERVAEAVPAPVLATADADDRHEPSPSQAVPVERVGDAEVASTDEAVAGDPLKRVTTNGTDDEAADAVDVGSLDLALLTALEPEKIGEAGRFAEIVPGVRVLAIRSGVLASGGEDGSIRLWNVESKRPLRELSGHTAGIHCLAFSPDGTQLASGGDDGTIRLWDVATGGETQQFEGQRQAVADVAFAPDGQSIYSIDVDGGLKKWNLASGEAVRSLDGGVGFAKLAISPSGDAILVGDWAGGIHQWDGTSPGWTNPVAPADESGLGGIPFAAGPTGPAGEQLRLHATAIDYLHVDGEGHVVSADATGEAIVWNLATGEPTGRFATDGSIVGHVASPEGTILLSADREGTIQVWDPETESVTHHLIGHEGPIAALVRSASGELAVSAGHDGTLRLWSLPQLGEQ